MRSAFFIILLLCSMCVQLACASETDTAHWTLEGTHPLSVGGSFTTSGYTVTLNDINNHSVLVTISKGNIIDKEIMSVGDSIFFNDDMTQIDYTISSDTTQTFESWVLKAPVITLTTSTIRWDNVPHYKCDLILHNSGVDAQSLTARFTLPKNCTIPTNTAFDGVTLTSATDQTKTVYFACYEPLPSRDVILNLQYTFMDGKHTVQQSKVITLPMPDNPVITTVVSPDASPAQIQNANNASSDAGLSIIVAPTPAATQIPVQTPVAPSTTTQPVTTVVPLQTTTPAVTQSTTTTASPTNGPVITSPPLPAIPQPPKTVDFRKVLANKAAAEKAATDKVIADKAAAENASKTTFFGSNQGSQGVVKSTNLSSAVSTYQLSRDEKGVIVIITLIFSWLAIIKL